MGRQAFCAAALAALVAACLVTAPLATAKGGGHSSGHHGAGHSSSGSGSYRSSHSSAPHASGHAAPPSSHASFSRHAPSSSGSHNKNYAQGVARDSHGKIVRSERAKNDFKKSHPCPSTGKTGGGCPGYVIDHKQALKRGGKDEPSNMQWQTKQAAKEKDKWE